MKALLLAAASMVLVATIANAAPRVGAPAPAFVGKTIDGSTFDLSAERGHVVVVNLWATWCPPCRAEMPMLDTFYRQHQRDGLVLVGLSADRHRDAEDVRRVMQKFTFPAALLSDARTNEFGAPGVLPMTVVIRKDGMVAAVFASDKQPLQREQLEEAISGG